MDLRVNTDHLDFLVSPANLAMVRMDVTARGDHLEYMVRLVCLDLLVPLVLMATVIRQHATFKQVQPISLWI